MSAPGIVVRTATGDDADVLATLCEEHSIFERVPYAPEGKPALLRSALAGVPPGFSAWVAADNGALVGYATATTDFST